MTGRPCLVVLRALHLGDLLTAVPALRALRRAFSDHHQVLATPATFAPLVRQEDWADEIFDTRELAPLGSGLAAPDIAVDLHGRGPGSQPLLLALRPRRLIAFAHPEVPQTAGGPRWLAGEHEVRRWCRLLWESGVPADPRELSVKPPPGPVPECAREATIIHPGASSAARRWPIERYAAIARAELRSGRRVVVTGSAAERSLADRLTTLAGLGRAHNFAGRTDLLAFVRLVAAAGRVVCGDTGVAHLATALGTPSVVLFGPVPPSEWGPPTDDSRHVALWAGRRGDPHADVVDAGLLQIGVRDVQDALATLTDRAGVCSP